jgi:hypothetical protein
MDKLSAAKGWAMPSVRWQAMLRQGTERALSRKVFGPTGRLITSGMERARPKGSIRRDDSPVPERQTPKSSPNLSSSGADNGRS